MGAGASHHGRHGAAHHVMPGRQPMSMLGLTLNSVYSFEVIKDAELLRACRMMASNSIPESALPPADDEWDLKAVHIGVWHERDASTKCPPLACLRIFLRLSDSPLNGGALARGRHSPSSARTPHPTPTPSCWALGNAMAMAACVYELPRATGPVVRSKPAVALA